MVSELQLKSKLHLIPSISKQRLQDTHFAFVVFPDLSCKTRSGSQINVLLMEIISEIKKAEENAKKLIDNRSLRGGSHD